MSKLTPKARECLKQTWTLEVLDSLIGWGLSTEEMAELIEEASTHASALAAALSVKKHGFEFCDPQLIEAALKFPYVTDEERAEWTGKPPARAQRDTRWYNRKGFVYLMLNRRNGFVKIGFSKTPENREKTLQSEEPEIELIFSREGTAMDEVDLHEKYKEKRLRGEWFRLTPMDIEAIKSTK